MENSAPIVTIGIPMYNASDYVGKCLDSLRVQSIPHEQIEVICVDDGSTDDTVAKAEAFRNATHWGSFRILEQENSGGPATGRNRVIDEAKGKYIFFVDVDDYLGPEALAAVVQVSEVEDADVTLAQFVGVNRGVPKYVFRQTQTRTDVSKSTLMDSMNVLKVFRTEFVRTIGYRFNPRLQIAEDHPFTLAAYANTDRVAVQGDVDCYFWVRHATEKGKEQHLTGQQRTVKDFYAYMYESFGVLALAAARGHEMAEIARRNYWNRLLTLDIPNEILRRTKDDVEESISAAKHLISAYGATGCKEHLTPRANLMLGALTNTDAQFIQKTAKLIRQ